MSQQVPPEFRELLVQGLTLFDEGHFHDAHDVLEEIWLDEVGDAKRLMQAIIQLSVGLYHRERGNRRGALKLMRRAGEILGELPVDQWSFDVPSLAGQCRRLAQEVEEQNDVEEPSYDPVLIPVFAADRDRLQ